jgi:hypothetical protein
MRKQFTTPAFKNFNPFAAPTTSGPSSTQTDRVEAVVIDVVVNDTHPEYAMDGYNVGAIKFRSLTTDQYRADALLNWAFPLETNLSEYPLPDEIVIVFASLNRFYYTRKINTTNRVTTHAISGLNAELSEPQSQNRKAGDLDKTAANPIVVGANTAPSTGFIDDPKLYRLRHDVGDLVFEGRSGQSIRFGVARKQGVLFKSLESDQAPNLLLRVGQSPSATPSVATQFGLVTEDINSDRSSIWMVTDQSIPLKFATESSGVHRASILKFPQKLDGNQIVINSDRIVLNAKKTKLLGFAVDGIHWTTSSDFTVDADRDYLSTITGSKVLKIGKNFKVTAGKVSVIAPKVHLGTEGSTDHPTVCGDSLAEFLGHLITALTAGPIVVTTASPGSPSPLSPTILAALQKLKADVAKGPNATFNSSVVFTTK